MRLIFMGNGPFAEPALRKLAASGHTLERVVARPDLPQGKHKQIIPGPVRAAAEQLGITVDQPESVNTADFISHMDSFAADLLVVADFGQLLKPGCLAVAKHGGINIHGSLLPKYRGAAPIVWAIANGETETGVSIIQMSPRMDAGGVIAQQSLSIGADETAEELEPRLAILGAELAASAIEKIAAGNATAIPQDPALVTQAPKLTKQDGRLDWNHTARQLHDRVRAMIPWPIAFTFWNRRELEPMRILVLKTRIEPQSADASPGQVAVVNDQQLAIATRDGILFLEEIQPAGKKPMPIAAFLRGHRPHFGDIFG